MDTVAHGTDAGQLHRAIRVRRAFLRSVTHELATPLTPMLGYVRLLLAGDLGPLSPLQRRGLEAIETAARRLHAVVDTLLDVGAVETGRLRIEVRPIDLAQTACSALHAARARAQAAGVSFVVAEDSTSVPGSGDGDRLRRAMEIVLDHAVALAPPRSRIAVQTRIGGRAGARRWDWIVACEDAPRDVRALEALLDVFHDSHDGGRHRSGTMGLGLGFPRRLVEAMGGTLEVVAAADQNVAGIVVRGPCIRLSMPVREADGRRARGRADRARGRRT
ncbi:MAG: histidine kinase dimerization/phospho-acceptor domain-containing protein [Myxococcales bacterium]|nr:histidine kinase dimerization/phospho-acceptor domain-containing protein [Myxococcales bacterium]